MDKNRQRKFLKDLRNSLSADEVRLKSEAIARRLTESEIYKNARTVMTYISIGSEVSTDEILRRIIADGKIAAAPLCGDDGVSLSARIIESPDQLISGYFGIPEPRRNTVEIDKNDIDLIIVPGLGFDRNGYRIGYGKGFYDRFLTGFDGITIGLCFDKCLLDSICRDEHDKQVDYVYTESAALNYK